MKLVVNMFRKFLLVWAEQGYHIRQISIVYNYLYKCIIKILSWTAEKPSCAFKQLKVIF